MRRLFLCTSSRSAQLRHASSRTRSHSHEFAANAGEPITLKPIGVVRSPYSARFGTPRQAACPSYIQNSPGALPGLQSARVELSMDAAEDALIELNSFTHCWLITLLNQSKGWTPAVRPPRADMQRVGVLATRSPDRPSPIGLSACEIVEIRGSTIHVFGCDLIDGTPVLDVKPYLPYADSIRGAGSGWAGDIPPRDYEGMRLTPAQEAENRRQQLEGVEGADQQS